MRRAHFTLLLAGCLIASSARADVTDSDLVAQGIQLRREKRDAEALQRFRQAYELVPAPKTRVQIALAEQALGDWISAEKDLSEALSHDDPWIAERAEVLRASLADIRTHLALLQIETNVADAELWQKGALVGKVSVDPVRIVSGELEVEIRANGYQPARRAVSVPAQSIVKLVVDLSPIGEPAAPAPSIPVVQSPPPVSSVQATLAWVTLAAAGASLATGIVGHVVHDVNATRYNNSSYCNDGVTPRSQLCAPYRERADSAQTVAIAGYVGAGLLGGASALLFLLTPPKAKTNATLDLRVLPSAIGVTYERAF